MAASNALCSAATRAAPASVGSTACVCSIITWSSARWEFSAAAVPGAAGEETELDELFPAARAFRAAAAASTLASITGRRSPPQGATSAGST